MENFNFYSPTYFAFGAEKENDCGTYVKKFGGTHVLIHYGGESAIKSGLIERVRTSLSKNSITFEELGGVKPNPRSDLVNIGIKVCREKKVDFILAVGGGSTIDSAKAIALGTLYDGDFWDFYTGKATPEKALPVGTILTIAAAGSEGSGDSVITNVEGMVKRGTGGDCIRPKFSVLNPELTTTLSLYQTACGATDIMAHVFERYFTNTKDVEVTDRLCEAILLSMITEVPKVMKNPTEYQARANVMWAGMVAHNNIVGVGRSQDWNSHAIEHELSGYYDCAHGAGLAVIMPAWMQYVMKHDVMRFAQVAVRVWGCDMDDANPEKTAMEGIQSFKKFLSSIGMPITLAELGAKEEDIPVLVKNMGLGDGKTGGFLQLDNKAVEEIYNLAK
ncbi:MAG TPA: iron-containing alcohol dehydrogenase [Lachnospiraceae bacterium]|nr:iron-containing alcohol dehydrogenase [Lachnospiraceae bacterium]